MKLTDAKIAKLTKPGRYGDAVPTLSLLVKPSGRKSWVQRIVINGRRKDIGLGGWPTTSLDEAREEALANRRAVKAQRRATLLEIEPQQIPSHRPEKTPIAPTFKELALEWLEATSPTWKESTRDKVTTRYKSIFENVIFPEIGNMKINEIQKANILKIISPIWTTKHSVAKNARRLISLTFRRAMSFDYCDKNLAGEAIEAALPNMKGATKNFRALPHNEVRDAISKINSDESAGLAVKLSLQLIILTACRSNEARGMLWEEIDGNTWTIPAERMKAGKTHRVSLSQSAQEIIERARALNPSSKGLVFPSPQTGKELREDGHRHLMKNTGLANKTTIHGFRSSFRDWCADTGKSRELAEAALAHTVQGVEGAYLRSDRLEPRRQLMEQWAQYVTGTTAKVVQLHG